MIYANMITPARGIRNEKMMVGIPRKYALAGGINTVSIESHPFWVHIKPETVLMNRDSL
jgi:hypothetical protein